MQESASVPIARAQMRLRICIPIKEAKLIKSKLLEIIHFESEDWSSEFEGVGCLLIQICLVDPGLFKRLNEMLQLETKGKGTVEILNLYENAKDSLL